MSPHRGAGRAGLLLALGLLLLLGAPALSRAQNASVAGTLELYPTLNCIGARLAFGGDADSDAVAHLEWRRLGQPAWTRGVDMSRMPGIPRWSGSVLWLDSGTRYEVRALIEDPDGGGSAQGAVTTRVLPPLTPSGATWWVATNGLDTNPGSSTAPLATVQAAANRAQPGDQIRVRAGIYYQGVVTPRAGTPGAPIHLIADGPGTILDGSDPAMLHRSDWRADGGGIFSVPFTAATRLVCADSLQRLYRQSSLAQLQADFNGMSQAWAIEGGRLYVKLGDGSSPATHTMHVARLDVGVYVKHDDWHVSGFEVRYCGTVNSPAAGICLQGASRCVVSGNHVHTIGGKCVLLRLGAADDVIEGNLLRDPRIGVWPRTVSKSHEEEQQGVSNGGGRGNVIRSNTIQYTFDGIDARSGESDVNVAADSDVHDNLVIGIADDGLEPETCSGINVRLWHNMVRGCYSGISIAPITQGPEYVLYNTFTDYTRNAYKFSISSDGQVWLCHNTSSTTLPAIPSLWGSGTYSNKHFRGNILTGNGTFCVDDDPGESTIGNDFDGDLLYAPGSSWLFRWKGTNYATLATLRAGTGFETAGRSGDPMFVAPLGGDYSLKPGSPALDAAPRLPGINDCFVGAGPDMGAAEFCLAHLVDVPAPVPHEALRLEAPAPNPSASTVLLRFALPSATRVRIAVFDVSGRRVRTLAAEELPAGAHAVQWDGRDDAGRTLGPGLYLVRLEAQGEALARRVVRIE